MLSCINRVPVLQGHHAEFLRFLLCSHRKRRGDGHLEEDLQGVTAPASLETVGWQAGSTSAGNRPLRVGIRALPGEVGSLEPIFNSLLDRQESAPVVRGSSDWACCYALLCGRISGVCQASLEAQG